MFRALVLVVALVLLVVAMPASPHAVAGPGDSLEEAEFLPLQNGKAVWVGALNGGQSRWLKLQPTESQPGAITLHLRPEDRSAGRRVTAYLWLPVRTNKPLEQVREDPRYPTTSSIERVGQLEVTADTGPDRQFLLTNLRLTSPYFIEVRNGSDQRIPLAITVENRKEPGQYDVPSLDALPAQDPAAGAQGQPGRPPSASGASATAHLIDTDGNAIGIAHLVQTDAGLQIQVLAIQLEPGEHGIHLHAAGSCDPPDFASAGSHVNPGARQHGRMNPAGAHAGDLPNLTGSDDGTAFYETLTDQVTLSPGGASLLDADGSAVVIHALPDDGETDPSGNSGDRVACGVIVPDQS